MIKVLFYHAGDSSPISAQSKKLFLSIAAIYLKTHLEIYHSDIAKQVEWLIPLQHRLSDDELLKICHDQQPDLLCTSHYIWNQSFLNEQLERIKEKLNSSCKILAGGPSIDVNINSNFFKDYPFIDYAIYGSGEAAFADLVSHIVNNKKLIAFNVSNLAWQSEGKTFISDYKYVPQLKTSPFLYNEDFFTKIVKNEYKNGYKIILSYELTRGCPYSCTFCDWNSGLSNKVTRRKETYKEEIDLFQKLKIQDLYLADANFGQYNEDISLVEYLVHKNLNENAGFTTESNLSKLKKDNNLKIYHLFAKGNLISNHWGFTFSVQDINPTILQNINRPDVGWDVHLDMINELSFHYPDIQSKIQFIVGLPGQNAKTIRESLGEITKHNLRLCLFLNELLPASPASLDNTYQEKFKVKYSNSERYNGFRYYKGSFPESCISYDREEFVEMVIISSFYSSLSILRFKSEYSNIDIERTVDHFIKSKHYKLLKENLLTNWIVHDKFYFTKNFDGSEKIISACLMVAASEEWANTKQFNLMLAQVHNNDREFVKKLIKQKEMPDWFPETH
jgi:putative methyltransferase